MMTEMKKCLKLCKYGYQFKTNIISGTLFFVLGLLFLFTTGEINVCLSGAYLFLGPTMMAQLMYNMLFSNLVASASLRKVVDRAFPDMVGAFAGLFAFGMTYVGLLVNPDLRTGTLADSGNVVIASAISIAVVTIYYSMCFKIFVAGTIFFFCTYLGAIVGCELLLERAATTGLLFGSVIGIIILVAGNVLSYVLRAALYKRALSPFAGGYSLRKAMK